MILADPGVAMQTAWMTAAGNVYCAGLPGAGVNQMVPEVQSGMLALPFMDHRVYRT